jgi:archaellum component FlaF (FlaF/FlaG flagellin family)
VDARGRQKEEKQMALTKEVSADKIEVVTTTEGTVVQVRTATKVLEDGEVISSSYHRHVINSGDDYSAEPANVQAVCTAVFTGE